MTLQAGKFYRTRDGRKAKVLCTDAPNHYPAVGYMEGWGAFSWALDGAFADGAEYQTDLVSEWIDKPAIDWSKLPAWATCVAWSPELNQWHWTSKAPTFHTNCWVVFDGLAGHIPTQYAPPAWTGKTEDSLTMRPGGAA